MKVIYTNNYNKNGCNLSGYLAVVELGQRMQEIGGNQPLGGFGRMAYFDALNEAKAIVQELHPEYRLLLGIPDMIAAIPEDEWNAMAQATNDARSIVKEWR